MKRILIQLPIELGEQGDHKQIDNHFGASLANKTGWLLKLMNHGSEYVFNLTDPFGLNNMH